MKHPASYYEQKVELECFYDKESPIWVSALPQADEWIGFFVTGPPGKALTWTGEYYNLLFAPRDIQESVRTLRAGDKITIIGEGFHYHSQSLDGVGIHVEQVLRGWGASAKPVAGASGAQPAVTGMAQTSTTQAFANQKTAAVTSASPSAGSATTATRDQAAAQGEKYVVIINGRRYTGLRFGDRYDFDGVDFQVERQE